MPRQSSGPRLWWDRERERFTIVDGRSNHRTGFGAAEIRRAEAALREYIEKKHRPANSEAPLIADILATYAEEHIKHTVSGKHIQYDLRHLAKWWGTKRIVDINTASCRAYVSARDAGACSRRELAFLNAAIHHWKANHSPMMPTPKIKLPPKPAAEAGLHDPERSRAVLMGGAANAPSSRGSSLLVGTRGADAA
jgi:hypothetical protein